MTTQSSTMDYLMDQLRGAGPLGQRRMFGEYCLYFDGRPVGLVCDDQLYLKDTVPGRALMEQAAGGLRLGTPFPGARAHLHLTPDDWEDRPWLARLVRQTYEALPPAAPARKTAAASGPLAPKARPVRKLGAQTPVQELPNLGPRSAQMLQDADIATLGALRKIGAVSAYVRVRALHPRASLNLLWALEGALSNTPWQDVAHQHRTSLLLALEQATQQAKPTARTRKRGGA